MTGMQECREFLMPKFLVLNYNVILSVAIIRVADYCGAKNPVIFGIIFLDEIVYFHNVSLRWLCIAFGRCAHHRKDKQLSS